MIQQHKDIFSKAAKGKFWILVRVTNKHSLPYIGNPLYSPKRMDCKAKTADKDVGNLKLKGLVASPKIHPTAFGPDKLTETLSLWTKMQINENNDPAFANLPYKVDLNRNSKHYGCLMYHEKYIHGDYDLFDIIDVNQLQRNLALHIDEGGRIHRMGANFKKIQDFVNAEIKTDMIQHGGEAQFRSWESVSEQYIDVFGPNGEVFTIINKFSLISWYNNQFKGRKLLG